MDQIKLNAQFLLVRTYQEHFPDVHRCCLVYIDYIKYLYLHTISQIIREIKIIKAVYIYISKLAHECDNGV